MLERVQRRVTKMIPDLRDTPYHDRLRHLGLQTLETRRHRSDLILAFKIIRGLVDFPVEGLFQFAPQDPRGHHLKLRYRRNPRLDIRMFTFAERVIGPWNALPDRVVGAESVSAFKRLLHVSGAIPEL